MKCPKCHSDNTDTARFCSNCATALAQAGQPPALTKTLESPAYVLSKGSLIAGKYRVLEEIGRGGMGVVYKAEDTKLARKVAIKVLPEVFTSDLERLARFEREARVLASLNHPNIAAIYGVEEADGKRFLVLELVEGETLAERLGRGALSLEDTLEVCRQIAEGLEGAHEKAIIHRDLKPSNVKITHERKVKILDFGLAKALHDQVSEFDISKSPTITADMTEPGVILGTAAYMSPEQATGRAVDKRADIWAFGCILFECLAGKRPFLGDTVTESIAAILRGEPDWDSLPVGTPGNVQAVLRRCLQKDPRQRLRDIGDARVEIEASGTHPSEAIAAPRRFPLLWVAAISVVMLIAGIITGRLLTKRSQPTPSPSMVSSTIKVEPGYWLDGIRSKDEMERPSRTAVAISRDGRSIVYSAIKENPSSQDNPHLYLRRTDQQEAKLIPGTEGGISPFLSPDGRSVGFWAGGKLKKVAIDGGVPATLCDVEAPFGATWNSDNRIVFSPGKNTGLFGIPAEGGTPQPLTTPDKTKEEYSHRLPFWLPGGKGILFTVMREYFDAQPRVAVLHPKTRQWHYLLEDAADARYMLTGHLIFLRKGTLMAASFDLNKLEVTSQPLPIIDDVMQALYSIDTNGNTTAGQFSVSDSGCLVYAVGGVFRNMENALIWVDQRGNVESAASFKADFYSPRLSPDGERIAYTNRGKDWRIWVLSIKRGTAGPLIGEGKSAYNTWTPDCRRLIFGWWRSGPYNLHWQPSDGSLPMERLATTEYWQRPGPCSPDGNTLVFLEDHPDTSGDILFLDLQSRRVTSFLNSRYDERYPELSPDGGWIAYSSDQSGRYEVYVRSLSGIGSSDQISSEGGREPLWARNGKRLFYRWENQVWVVAVQTGKGFSASKPILLFEKPGLGTGEPIRGWDLSLDGQRFLMVKEDDRKPEPATEIMFVQNWFEELKRLLPADKK